MLVNERSIFILTYKFTDIFKTPDRVAIYPNSSSIVIGTGDISEYIFSLRPYVVTRLTCIPPL